MRKRILVLSILLSNLAVPLVYAKSNNETIESHYLFRNFRKLTADEIIHLKGQAALKNVSCDEYFIDKDSKLPDNLEEEEDSSLFKGHAVTPNGKVICKFYHRQGTNHDGVIIREEAGVIDGVFYEFSFFPFDSTISGSVGELELVCSMVGPWQDIETKKSIKFKGCAIAIGHFAIQRVPDIKLFDIPEGYLISFGSNDFVPLLSVTIDGKTFKSKPHDAFITGKDARQLINSIRADSTISYQYAWPYKEKPFEEEIDYYYIERIKPALKILDYVYSAYK